MSRQLVALIGAALLTVGLVIGFLPVSSTGVDCGSPFVSSNDAAVADYTEASTADRLGIQLGTLGRHRAACEDALGAWRVPSIALITLGGIAVAGGLLRRRQPA